MAVSADFYTKQQNQGPFVTSSLDAIFQFSKDGTFSEQILSLERLPSEYQGCVGQDIAVE